MPGTYQIPGLSIGAYTVTASKAGFRSVEFKNVDLAVGQPRTIDIQMEVGTVAGAVEVNAALETINRTSAEVGGLIESAQIKEIPHQWAELGQLDDVGARRHQLRGRRPKEHPL